MTHIMEQGRVRIIIRRVLVILLSILLIGSALITLNDLAGWGIVPTWDDLFAEVGLTEEPLSPDQLRVTFLDVGNADCTLIQCGGKTALIDAGEYATAENVVEQLRIAGVERLDYVIATHADADHIGGMATLIHELEIGTFLMPAQEFLPETMSPVYHAMVDALGDKGILPMDAQFGFTCHLGKAQLKIISGRQSYTTENDNSILCRLSYGKHSFLFMSDVGTVVEHGLMSDGVALQADVIKIGHHGSQTSSDPQFIRLVAPTYAVITCGVDNASGHPHEATLNTLKENDVAVYRSDYHGNIAFTCDGETLSVTTQRQGFR